jgi:AraC-like DNA-binding protein
MLFLHRVPAPPLDAAIACLWYCEDQPKPFALERVLPSGAAQLIVNLKEDQTRMYKVRDGIVSAATSSGTILSGVASGYCLIDTAETEHAAGVAFHPGGTLPFFALPADILCDCDVPLESLWGRRRTAELRERLLAAPSPEASLDILEQTLLAAWTPCRLHPAVGFALGEFDELPGASRIASVADSTGLSPKRFIERFKTSVGITPKHYCRIRRFQTALAAAENGRRVDWTRIALDCGYFDQAHFIRDFRAFSGITPTGYEIDRTQFRNHVKFVQSSVLAS